MKIQLVKKIIGVLIVISFLCIKVFYQNDHGDSFMFRLLFLVVKSIFESSSFSIVEYTITGIATSLLISLYALFFEKAIVYSISLVSLMGLWYFGYQLMQGCCDYKLYHQTSIPFLTLAILQLIIVPIFQKFIQKKEN